MSHRMINYGTFSKLLQDLGEEFNGEELRELLGTMGIQESTTDVFSQFSNENSESHNAILKSMFDKFRDDQELKEVDSETILKQSC